MKKLNLLAIMILIVTIGTITNVKAETCVQSYISNLGGKGITQTLTLGTNSIDIPLRQNITINKNYQYSKYYAYYLIKDTTTNNIISNINLETTCTEEHLENMAPTMTITYADGTRANIAGSTYETICDAWETRQVNTSPTIIENYEPNITSMPIRLLNTQSQESIFCNFDKDNGLLTCPNTINNNMSTFDTIRIQPTLEKHNFATFQFGISTGIIFNCNSDSQSIINNQNQNAQQQHQDNQNINNSIQDTNNTLNDASIDSNNTSSSTSDWNNKVASNGTITNLLTLPIQLMQGYVNGMNSTCTPFNLGNLFGTNIILPCINVGALIGSSLWSVIDVLFSGFMIFGIAKKLIKIFNDFTNMKSNQVDELYGGGA